MEELPIGWWKGITGTTFLPDSGRIGAETFAKSLEIKFLFNLNYLILFQLLE
jgi:hypothetical protein